MTLYDEAYETGYSDAKAGKEKTRAELEYSHVEWQAYQWGVYDYQVETYGTESDKVKNPKF